MNHINIASPGEWSLTPNEADVVVVGGGLTGLEVAKQLDKFGVRRVVVLEAGAGVDLRHINAVNNARTAERLWRYPENDKYFQRSWISLSNPHFSGIAGIRRRLGGRSLYWHGVTLPLDSWALCEPWWPSTIIRDLTHSWRGGSSLYEQTRSELEIWRNSEVSQTITTADSYVSLIIGRYVLTKTPQAVHNVVVGDEVRWSAYSPLHYWLDPQGKLLNQTSTSTLIVPDVEVLGIKVGGNRASGLTVRHTVSHESRQISCSSIILAAGTIENTRLAIQALTDAGAIMSESLNGLVDHIVQGFMVTMSPTDVPEHLVSLARQGTFYFMPCGEQSRSNIFVVLRMSTTEDFVLDVWTMGEQMPSSAGTVQCIKSEDWPWGVRVRTALMDIDWDVVNMQRQEMQSFWNDFCTTIGRAKSMLEFGDFTTPTRTLTEILEITDSGGQCVTWSSPLGTEDHEGGTIPLGRILNDRHEFVSVQGLFATGPSTFPRIGAANPSLTSLALANRLAALLST